MSATGHSAPPSSASSSSSASPSCPALALGPPGCSARLRVLPFNPSIRLHFAMGIPMQPAAGYPLPDPERIGTSGYVWTDQFELGFPAVPDTHPTVWIDSLRWLKHILMYLGVHEVGAESFQLANSTAWQGRVDFSIPGLGHAGRPLELSVYGLEVIEEYLAKKYGVEAAIDLLAAVGREIPTYSSMLMEAMDKEALYSNVEQLCLIKAQNNTVHLDADPDMTYAGCSFEAIFDQLMQRSGHAWEYASLSQVLTTGGYQAKLVASKKGSGAGPSLIVLSRPCRRPAEATESVLCTALTYINDICGCRIGDLHYAKLFTRRFQRRRPGVLPGPADA